MKKPSGPVVAGLSVLLVVWAIYVALQLTAYRSISTRHVVSAEEFQSLRPTKGWYRVEGGRMGYERVEGGTHYVGGTVMRTASYRSYIPFMDMKTNNLILLIELIGDDANPKNLHENILPPGAKATAEDVEGTLYSSDEMDAGTLQDFATRQYAIPAGTPVLRMFDMPTSTPMVKRIVIATILMLALASIPFVMMFLEGQRKPRRRTPDKFTPSWRR